MDGARQMAWAENGAWQFSRLQATITVTRLPHSPMEVTIGHLDRYADVKCTVNIYLDEVYSQSITLEAEEMAKKLTIPLNQALQLKIELEGSQHWCYTGFANARLIR